MDNAGDLRHIFHFAQSARARSLSYSLSIFFSSNSGNVSLSRCRQHVTARRGGAVETTRARRPRMQIPRTKCFPRIVLGSLHSRSPNLLLGIGDGFGDSLAEPLSLQTLNHRLLLTPAPDPHTPTLQNPNPVLPFTAKKAEAAARKQRISCCCVTTRRRVAVYQHPL